MTNPRIEFLDLARINRSFAPQLNEAVRRVVESGSYIRGREVREFEARYASYIGSRACVSVGNGFDALRLIFRAWIESGILREGDQVLVPANTYIASILPVTESRLQPVFVEPDPLTMNLDISGLRKALTSRTRAVLLVHLYGRNAITPELMAFVKKAGLLVVEDNAQAAGCVAMGRRTGVLGHAAAHSFFPTKNLGALGDGGAVTTDDTGLADAIRTLSNYGSVTRGRNSLKGVNSRLDELQAAVLNVKLPRLDADNAVRRKIAGYYHTHIHHPAIELPRPASTADEHVWHLFVVRCRQRDALQQHLAAQGIESMIHYPVPPHKQPAFRDMVIPQLPVTERIHGEVLSLPLHPLLGQEELSRIVEAVSLFGG